MKKRFAQSAASPLVHPLPLYEVPMGFIQSALTQFKETRHTTEALCQPLGIEDYGIQSMPDVSPPKWHLAHTTWFFEEFILKRLNSNFCYFNKNFNYLFNSYYESLGGRLQKSQRGILSRPTVDEIYAYRSSINLQLEQALKSLREGPLFTEILERLALGIHHEQQHQELLLMDIQYNFWKQPLRPCYQKPPLRLHATAMPPLKATDSEWLSFEGGIQNIGFEGVGFHYDNECPRHKIYLNPFQIQSQLVTQGEYLEFMEDGGYQQPLLWLSDGWAHLQQNQWSAPLYWEKERSSWSTMTLSGMQPLQKDKPVSHLSYYEAEAFARWKGCRLPTEQEWEVASPSFPRENPLRLWQWTGSAYLPYPGFKPLGGALGEYNGKFMCNQMVLRGGSFATPESHLRPTYRNFFYPTSRWQFSGLRLAQ